jgi:hypothetical protein
MRFKKSIVAVVTAVGIIGSASAAYAFVKTTGQGSGNGSTGSAASNFTLGVEVLTPVELVPGDDAVVTIKVTNSSARNGKVKVSAIALSLPTAPAGCAAEVMSTLHLTNPTVPGATLLQQNENETFTGSIAMDDSDAVDQTCLLGKSIVVAAVVS